MNGSSKCSILFRVTVTLVAGAASILALVLLAVLTGGAILAPICFVALFAPLLTVQYLLWGRYLDRILLDEGLHSGHLEAGPTNDPGCEVVRETMEPSTSNQSPGDVDESNSPPPANR